MPRPSDEFIVLCTRQLSGEASPAERRRLDACLRRPECRAYYDDLRARWTACQPSPDAPAFEADAAYARLREKLPAPPAPRSVAPVVSLSHIRRFMTPWLAAALVALALLPALRPPTPDAPPAAPLWQKRTTAPGQHARVVLADGTRVTLNGASSLAFPATFGATRRVRLNGEASFEVAHDAAHPFVVQAGGLRTTVLGTKFNIAIAPHTGATTVSLLEGRVQVEPLQPAPSVAPVILQPGEEFAADAAGHTAVRRFDPSVVTAWQRGALVFRATPLADVIAQLERRFGVALELADPALGAKTIDASFGPESLDEILQVLAFAGGLRSEPVFADGATKRVRLSAAASPR